MLSLNPHEEMKPNNKSSLNKDLDKIENYSQFINTLKKHDLSLKDLTEHGTLRPFQLKAFKKMFKNKENDKKEWREFTKTGASYYIYVKMNPDIAYCNKNRK